MEVVPKYAASVILIRKNFEETADTDFEILLIKRSETMKFLGGFHAFPGGKIKDDDYIERNLKRCRGRNINQAYNILLNQKTSFKEKKIALSFWIAAIREVFEEVGILIAYKGDQLVDLSNKSEISRYQEHREKLIKNKISMLEIMEMEDLFYAVDKLHYFRHFITPPLAPIRFDTRFFLTKLPEGQQRIDPDYKEIADYEWLTPKASLKKYRKKEIKIIPPQYACLRGLMNKNQIKELERCHLI
ncbi:MAG: hypothetical protein HWN67_22050 [Candidatus Helarchaeota archaeon]|nr:hypothetical protein [Candidatus Helarchaeota archaeon]